MVANITVWPASWCGQPSGVASLLVASPGVASLLAVTFLVWPASLRLQSWCGQPPCGQSWRGQPSGGVLVSTVLVWPASWQSVLVWPASRWPLSWRGQQGSAERDGHAPDRPRVKGAGGGEAGPAALCNTPTPPAPSPPATYLPTYPNNPVTYLPTYLR